MVPLAAAGLALAVWEVAVRPAIVDAGKFVLGKLEDHGILHVDFGDKH